MVAPIALYPDSLLSQVLVASTYPLEIVEASSCSIRTSRYKVPALVDAAKKQNLGSQRSGSGRRFRT